MSQLLQQVVIVVLLCLGSVIVGASDDATQCVIPEGSFEGMIFDIQIVEPYYGDRCIDEKDVVQIRVWSCKPRYCCNSTCTCNSTNLHTENICPGTYTRIVCYTLEKKLEQYRYKCCSGSYEDQFHVCTKKVDCNSFQNGGCDAGQLCLRNDTSGLDYCDCSEGYNMTLVNSNGTKQCIDINECAEKNGGCSDKCTNTLGSYTCSCSENRTMLDDHHNCTYPVPVPVPAPIKSDPGGFPYPYIIAIVAGILLLLLLLMLLLLLLLCRRRRRRRAAAFANDTYGMMKAGDDEKKVVVGDKFLVVVGGKKTAAGSNGSRPENEYAGPPHKNPQPPRMTALQSSPHYETLNEGSTAMDAAVLPRVYEVVKEPHVQPTKVSGLETGGDQTTADQRPIQSVPNQYTELPGVTQKPQESPYANAEMPGEIGGAGRSTNPGTSYGYVDNGGYAEIIVPE